METVYKYCGAYGLGILNKLELKFTPPNQFNDPFEFTPKMGYSDPVGYARRYLQKESVLKWLYETKCAEGNFVGSFKKFQKLIRKQRAKSIKAFVSVLPLGAAQAEKGFLDEVSKHFGILCMSGRRDSILMWGHYCDKSLGLVIGFDKSSEIFRRGKGLKPVDYVKERVVFDSCWEDRSRESEIYEEKVIFSKSAAWEYEHEFRQILSLSSASLVKKPLEDKDHTPGYFLLFPPEAVVSVTLGPRGSPELETKVREILQRPSFSHVKLDRAVLHKNDFVLEFE